ncbi:MAG: FAD-dependent oxidoreductase [Rhodovibrionaceae bacterium]
MTEASTLKVAVVGSGPAGCYLAEKLGKLAPEGEVDVIDRLPTPFGLVRAGVAPDHQGTKAIARVLARSLGRGPCAFWGNVEVGRDVTLAELRALYDAVVLATGAPEDRKLGLPGEELSGVHGSGAFVGWYNCHPEHAGLAPDLSQVRSAVVIGNGNVAIDVARVLGKTVEEMAASDIAPATAAAISAAPLEHIHLVGRRGPAEAKFTAAELQEMGTLTALKPVLNPEDFSGAAGEETPVLEILRGFTGDAMAEKPVSLHFDFMLQPEAFLGRERLEAVRFQRMRPDGQGGYAATGEAVEIPAQLAVTCVGYESVACCARSPEAGLFPNRDGRIEDGLYVVGWAKRGPSGTIATNRAESHAVAEKLAGEIAPADKLGRAGLRSLLEGRGVRAVDFAAWQAIEAAEAAQAKQGRVREKFARIEDMLAVLDG